LENIGRRGIDAQRAYLLPYSEPLLTEPVDVFNRPRIRDKYELAADEIETVVALVLLRGEVVVPTRRIIVCWYPKDNMILETAADGRTDAIVRGDRDLLELKAFEEIPIVAPAESLRRLNETL
jgi:putative PIN family toxin of toxin-antitoxin system